MKHPALPSAEAKFQRQFRGGGTQVSRAKSILAQLRLEAKPSEMAALARAVRRSAPAIGRTFGRMGVADFGLLAWQSALPTATLEQELRFAAEWLSPHAIKLNQFRSEAIAIEKDILAGQLNEANAKLNEHEDANGFSFWAIELKFVLLQHLQGDDALRGLAQELSLRANARVAALAAQVFCDRNDSLFSIDRFIAKCEESFPNILGSESAVTYMLYRSLGRIDQIPDGLATVLSAEIFNGFIDYYESFVDICCTSVIHVTDERLRSEVLKSIQILLNAGYNDWRLNKAATLLGAAPALSSVATDSCLHVLSGLLFGQPFENGNFNAESIFLNYWIELIEEVNAKGISAQESIEKLVKIGVNYRGMTFGAALGSFAADQMDDIFQGNLISPWIGFMSPVFRIDELLWLRKEGFQDVTVRLLEHDCLSERDKAIANCLFKCLQEGDASFGMQLPDQFRVWLGREFVVTGHTAAARSIANSLDLDGRESKHALRILISADIEDGLLNDALERAALALTEDPIIAHTLPLKRIFAGRKWPSFRDADPMLLALVAYDASRVLGDARISFICRMACREYKARGLDARIAPEWSGLSEQRKQFVIYFYERVWVDEYLLLLDFDSSQAVRLERLRTVQLLVQLRGESVQRYTDEIKALTLRETLWRGLQDVNESRIFVNEAAILQWAERELSADYDRWQRAELSSRSTPIPTALVRDYLLEQDRESFLQALSKEKLSESTALLVGIVERLLRRFLTDPADGLNSYLSSRIRHGTLKGTILGPLEEAGLIGRIGSEIVADICAGEIPSNAADIARTLDTFSKEVNRIVDNLRDQRVQIRDVKHPDGAISVALDPAAAPQVLSDIAQNSSNFQIFVTSCFDAYWQALIAPLRGLSEFIAQNVKDQLQAQFDQVIAVVRRGGNSAISLLSLLRTTATATQSHCDIAADWFLLEKNSEQQTYSLHEAIEIAVSSARNVNRRFAAEVNLNRQSSTDIHLTSYGLAVITDCFYAILENAWKHSGLGTDMNQVDVGACLDVTSGTLQITAENQVADEVARRLKNGELERLRSKYTRSIPYELVPVEGGSGLAKLASMTKTVDRTKFPIPLEINVVEKTWSMTVCVPLYLRGEAYDAYA